MFSGQLTTPDRFSYHTSRRSVHPAAAGPSSRGCTSHNHRLIFSGPSMSQSKLNSGRLRAGDVTYGKNKTSIMGIGLSSILSVLFKLRKIKKITQIFSRINMYLFVCLSVFVSLCLCLTPCLPACFSVCLWFSLPVSLYPCLCPSV